MKTVSFLIAFGALTAAFATHAQSKPSAGGKNQEMCSVARTINGRMTWLEEPCAQRERPIPCQDKVVAANSIKYVERPCRVGEQKTYEQVQRDEEAVVKKKCGKDFGKLRVGMTLDRYEECTEPVDFITETVSKSGVVETYRGMFWLIQVQNGKIVSYTRL